MAKHRFSSWFFGTLLILGAICLIGPIIYDQVQNNQETKLADQYRKALYPADQRRDDLIKAYNQNAIARQQRRSLPYPNLSINQIVPKLKDPIGYISIPDIKLNAMPIFYGDSDQVLAKGTGVMPFTSLPAPGHWVTSSVTGHTGMANRIFFDNIRYLKKGDVFKLDVFAHRLAYQVFKIKVIDPSRADATANFYVKQKRNECILMTCTPIGINDHRLLVYGKRIPWRVAQHAPTHYRAAFSLYNLWKMAMLLILILITAWWLWRQHRLHQQKEAADETPA